MGSVVRADGRCHRTAVAGGVARRAVAEPRPVRGHISGAESQGERLRPEHPATAIRLDGTRRLTVDDTPGIYPNRRTNGIGLPDYLAGWFRLNDGRSALLFVTDWSRTIAVPTTAGYDLVLSPDAPDALVAMVKAPAAAGSTPGIFPLATVPARGWDASDLLPWLAFVLVPLVTVALLAPLLFAGRRVRFELGDESLRIPGRLVWPDDPEVGPTSRWGRRHRHKETHDVRPDAPDERHRSAELPLWLVSPARGWPRSAVRDRSNPGRRSANDSRLPTPTEPRRPRRLSRCACVEGANETGNDGWRGCNRPDPG